MKTFISFIMAAALAAMVIPTLAGTLTPPGAPSGGSGMPSTAAIFQQLSSGQAATSATSFQGPTAGPGASGKSLADIQRRLPVADNTDGAAADDVKAGKKFWGLRTDGTWGVKTGTYAYTLAKRVNKTGQTESYGTGDDGQYKYGIDPPLAPKGGSIGAYTSPALMSGTRFTDNLDGTVTDNLNSLIWLKNANCFGYLEWASALTSANTLASGACGLKDGSTAGQWRLPNINELHSLVDLSQGNPTLPPGHPFSNVQGMDYWSSSTISNASGSAWIVSMFYGTVGGASKIGYISYVWPVRSGQ